MFKNPCYYLIFLPLYLQLLPSLVKKKGGSRGDFSPSFVKKGRDGLFPLFVKRGWGRF